MPIPWKRSWRNWEGNKSDLDFRVLTSFTHNNCLKRDGYYRQKIATASRRHQLLIISLENRFIAISFIVPFNFKSLYLNCLSFGWNHEGQPIQNVQWSFYFIACVGWNLLNACNIIYNVLKRNYDICNILNIKHLMMQGTLLPVVVVFVPVLVHIILELIPFSVWEAGTRL